MLILRPIPEVVGLLVWDSAEAMGSRSAGIP